MNNRRTFLFSTSATFSALAVTPSRGNEITNASPQKRLRVAAVGIGGRGRHNIATIGGIDGVEIVALCDIDMKHPRAIETLKAFPNARPFADYRRLFETMPREFDAVIVSTPDHTHFPVTMEALRHGKHVYCEKPLAHTFRECELLMKAAKKAGVVTQMGNQGHSDRNYHQAVALSDTGVFNKITSVIAHAGHGKFWNDWSQRITGYRDEPKPEHIRWDLWSTTRDRVPYSSTLHPGRWRAWYPFGCGIFGDWGAHLVDTAHRFMHLDFPERVEATLREGGNDWIYPVQNVVTMQFPATAKRDAVELVWADGDQCIPENGSSRADGSLLTAGKKFNGEGFSLQGGSHGSPLHLIGSSDALNKEQHEALRDYENGRSKHHQNFVNACWGLETANSPFSVGGTLTQLLHVGTVAQRYGGVFKFDRESARFIGERADIANAMLDGPEVPPEWRHYYEA